jgi:hypothetical protein
MNRRAGWFAELVLVLVVGWISTPARAGTLTQGWLDFNICMFGKVDYPVLAKRLVNASFDRIATFMYDDGSFKPIDRRGSGCVGAYEVVDGRYRDHGVCTQVDADGDTWRMHYETGADLRGTWTTLSGSGKYEGITGEGEYQPVGNVPGVLAGGFKSCNHVTGTYRLK